VANIFFAAFVIVSNFVLLQLVIAVLMEQLEAGQENEEGHSKVPGCEHLDKHIMEYVHIHEYASNYARPLACLREKLAQRKLSCIIFLHPYCDRTFRLLSFIA